MIITTFLFMKENHKKNIILCVNSLNFLRSSYSLRRVGFKHCFTIYLFTSICLETFLLFIIDIGICSDLMFKSCNIYKTDFIHNDLNKKYNCIVYLVNPLSNKSNRWLDMQCVDHAFKKFYRDQHKILKLYRIKSTNNTFPNKSIRICKKY